MAGEAWRRVWREGIAPLLSLPALEALAAALASDDSRLVQGITTDPPPMKCVRDWPCERACAVAFAGWQGERLQQVEEVEAYFAGIATACGLRLGDSTAGRHFFNWFDDTPRDEMRRDLLPEVERVIAERKAND